MANSKISALTAATTPLAGTEVLPIVQSSSTVKASIANIQAATVSAGTANAVQYLNGSKTPTTSSDLTFDGKNLGLGSVSTWQSIFTAYQTGSGIGKAFMAGRADAGTAQNQLGSNAYFNSGWKYVATGVASRYEQSSGTHTWHSAPSGSADAAISFVQLMTLDPANGNLKNETGNFVVGTSGKGIDFSATPGTGTSELLNDYEEGTWTPTVTASGLSGVTYSTQSGTYIKVGRLVTVRGRVILSSAGTNSGTYTAIGGLPFASENANPLSPGSLTWFNLTGGTSGRMPYAMLYNGTSEINLLELDQNGLAVALLFQASRLTNTTEFNIELFYQTA
jgi:hypothetical protein